jgi:hypothetical protein
MIVSIHQPNYLPWLGFFHKISLCDQFVLLDTVPFSKNSYQNRCRIKTVQGEQWLTVPVLLKGNFAQPTNQVRVDSKGGCAEKHWRTIQQNYRRAPFFDLVANQIESVYHSSWDLLADVNSTLIGKLAGLLGITTPLVRASELHLDGSRSDLLCAICKSLGATVYLSGPSGRDYLDESVFSAEGITVQYHQFTHPTYKQMYDSFIPGLSTLDLLANCGPDSRALLTPEQRSGGG